MAANLPAARSIVRSHGDTAAEYRAAHTGAIVVDRADRALIRVHGRDPVKMLHGLVTNDVQNLDVGAATYAALLTPRGRMLADVRVFRRAADLLMECDAAALPNVLATVAKYVPPLFARAGDVTPAFAVAGVYGAAAAGILSRVLRADPDAGAAAPEFAGLALDRGRAAVFQNESVLVAGTGFAGVAGYDIVVGAARMDALLSALAAAGATPAGHAVLDVLRIEAGSPRWGAELTEDVIPLEAGIGARAISTSKGCYTGQEVIVRILHRGHVNRHLRGLLLDQAPTPAAGVELFAAAGTKSVARITSACWSPGLRQTIALAYVRREIEPGAELRLTAPDGLPATVVDLPFIRPEN